MEIEKWTNHTSALTNTAYTLVVDESDCSGSTTLCGILAEQAVATPTTPNLSIDAALVQDLRAIQRGTDLLSNTSGEVFFKD